MLCLPEHGSTFGSKGQPLCSIIRIPYLSAPPEPVISPWLFDAVGCVVDCMKTIQDFRCSLLLAPCQICHDRPPPFARTYATLEDGNSALIVQLLFPLSRMRTTMRRRLAVRHGRQRLYELEASSSDSNIVPQGELEGKMQSLCARDSFGRDVLEVGWTPSW